MTSPPPQAEVVVPAAAAPATEGALAGLSRVLLSCKRADRKKRVCTHSLFTLFVGVIELNNTKSQ